MYKKISTAIKSWKNAFGRMEVEGLKSSENTNMSKEYDVESLSDEQRLEYSQRLSLVGLRLRRLRRRALLAKGAFLFPR